MTCDYDHDCFGQGLKFQHSRESGHSHGQKVPKSRVPRQITCSLIMISYLVLYFYN